MKLTPFLLSAGILLSATAYAANPASDNGSFYQIPWGMTTPQNRPASGFAPWAFDEYNPPYYWWQPPNIYPPNPFFIDAARGAWGINVPRDHVPPDPTKNIGAGYDAAWTSFTGDGQLDPGQTFSTTVLFTPPGPHTTTEIATEGVDFFAQDTDPNDPSHYDTFGHQVLGIYLGGILSSQSSSFVLIVHTGNAPSDENGSVVQTLPFPFTGTASKPQQVKISYTQYPQGNWAVTLKSGGSALVLTSQHYGTTWNTQGVDAVRYFTSQGGTNPGGPLEWKTMSVK